MGLRRMRAVAIVAAAMLVVTTLGCTSRRMGWPVRCTEYGGALPAAPLSSAGREVPPPPATAPLAPVEGSMTRPPRYEGSGAR